jgi:hypothetical protein
MKSAKIAVEVPTWVGTKVVTVEVSATEAREARDPDIALALAAIKVPGISKFADFKALDEYVKRAYRKSALIRKLVFEKAVNSVNGDTEIAEAWIRAWLRSKNRELPEDDNDAYEVSKMYYKFVWKMGSKFVVQVAPWE